MQKDRWLSLLKEKVRWLFQTVSVKNVGVFFYIPIVMWSHLHFTTCISYQQIIVPSPVFGFSAKNFCRVWLGLMFWPIRGVWMGVRSSFLVDNPGHHILGCNWSDVLFPIVFCQKENMTSFIGLIYRIRVKFSKPY